MLTKKDSKSYTDNRKEPGPINHNGKSKAQWDSKNDWRRKIGGGGVSVVSLSKKIFSSAENCYTIPFADLFPRHSRYSFDRMVNWIKMNDIWQTLVSFGVISMDSEHVLLFANILFETLSACYQVDNLRALARERWLVIGKVSLVFVFWNFLVGCRWFTNGLHGK